MFTETPIQDLLIYTPRVFADHRGRFFESYNARLFQEKKINTNFVQDNRSTSAYGTLRGLHLQTGSSAQAKFVTVLQGHVYDVAVDLRPQSPTFKKWFGIDLFAEEPKSLYVPRGFAHGFVVLSPTAEFFYKVDNFYDKASEAGVAHNDLDLAINWKIPEKDIILSEKDKVLPSLKNFLALNQGKQP